MLGEMVLWEDACHFLHLLVFQIKSLSSPQILPLDLLACRAASRMSVESITTPAYSSLSKKKKKNVHIMKCYEDVVSESRVLAFLCVFAEVVKIMSYSFNLIF